MVLSCRFYRNPLPDPDQFVAVEVTAIGDIGIDVILPEYNNQQGMILSSELTRVRMRSIHKLVRIGRREIAMVLRVDPTKRYVDLSRRRVLKEDTDEAEEKFARGRTVNSILQRTAEALGITTNEGFEKLYENVAWYYDEKYDRDGAIFDVLVRAAKIESVLDDCPVDEETKQLLLEDARRRFTASNVKCRAIVSVRCYSSAGIDAIKEAIRAGLTASTSEHCVAITLIASPFFALNVTCNHPQIGIALIQEAIDRIQTTIEQNNGFFEVKEKPKVVNASDEGKVAAMLRDAASSSLQVPGDDDISDEQSDIDNETSDEFEE